jgi:hypothetical protein
MVLGLYGANFDGIESGWDKIPLVLYATESGLDVKQWNRSRFDVLLDRALPSA